MTPSLSLFFIVEPQTYQYFACYLAASIRRYLDPAITLVGYCPQHRMDELDPAVVTALTRMDCAVRPMRTQDVFDPAYPHGNKLIACLEPRQTDWGGFLDSDIVFVAPHDIARLLRPDHVSCALATSIGWAPETLWEDVYGAFGMTVPEDRVRLSRNQRQEVPPYFNSGMVPFPETHRNPEHKSFAETWMETAQVVDRVPVVEPHRRPYLDQITLPVAMRRAGLGWTPMEERDHFILGGRRKHSAVPLVEQGIAAVHYRHWEFLDLADLAEAAKDSLEGQIGVRRVRALVEEGVAARDAAPRLEFSAEQPGAAPTVHRDVRLVPWGNEEPGETRRAAGLFAANGSALPEGHCWRDAGAPLTLIPEGPKGAAGERLEGRWLYGGMFCPQFGRFLTESTSRLWAIDGCGTLDGIIFVPEQPARNERRLYRHHLPIFEALGLGHLRVRAPQADVVIEELVIPQQGFGSGGLIVGRPDYRHWFTQRLAALAPADTDDRAEDIYISRSALTDANGDTFGQARIDALMADAGYGIVHPETLSFEEQVRTYRAARRIVALDGAALLLAAMAVRPETRVAIIKRGPSGAIADHLRQFRQFAGIAVQDIDAVRGFYHPAGRRTVLSETRAVLDLAKIGLTLATSGFIPTAIGWDASVDAEIEAERSDMERRLNTKFDWRRS